MKETVVLLVGVALCCGLVRLFSPPRANSRGLWDAVLGGVLLLCLLFNRGELSSLEWSEPPSDWVTMGEEAYREELSLAYGRGMEEALGQEFSLQSPRVAVKVDPSGLPQEATVRLYGEDRLADGPGIVAYVREAWEVPCTVEYGKE